MAVHRGDEAACDYGGLEACYREFRPRLLRRARALGAKDPEGAVQNVFVQLAQRWDERDRTRSMWPLLHRMLCNGLVDEWRRKRRWRDDPTCDVGFLENALESAARPTVGVSEPEQAVISADRDRIVRVEVAAMSPDERSVLYRKTGESLPGLPGEEGTPDKWVMRRKGPSVMKHMRCVLEDARGLFPAVGCGAVLTRWWAKLQGSTAAAVGGASVTAALALGGTLPWLDDPDPAPPPSREAEALPPPISLAPAGSSRPIGDQGPTKGPATINRPAATTEPRPGSGGDPGPPSPIRRSLRVDPDTGPGEKERDETQIDTYLGTLTVGGNAHATGPIGELPCLADACSGASQTGINGP